MSYIVLGETLQPKQIVGGCVTITGAILLVVDLDKRGRGFDLVTFFLMSAACLMNACTVVIFAGLMAPLALVSIVTGLHPFFLLFYGILFTLFFPTFGRERLARRQILQRVVAVGVMCAGMATTFIA